MRVGIVLNPSASPATFAQHIVLAEKHGLESVWTANHVSSRDPFMCFTEAARITNKIRMGPVAVSPFELHPLKMANLLLTLNEMSNGRSDIVIGGGGETMIAMNLKPTFESMHPQMVSAVRECIEFIKQVSPDKLLNFEGDVYQVHGYQPKWATQEPPRLYVAASKKRMMRMCAEVADGVMMSDGTLPMVKDSMEIIKAGLAATGRSVEDFRINNLYAWHVKKDKDEAVHEARRKLWVRGMLLPWYLEPFLSEADVQLVQDKMDSFMNAYFAESHEIEGVPERILDALVENVTLTGSIDEIDTLIGHLKAFETAGLNEIALRIYDDVPEAIRLISESVIPALR